MLKLPFLLPPHADEILGSWFSRSRSFNGDGAWKTLLASAGFPVYDYVGRRTLSFFDIPNYSSPMANFLAALGVTYEEALLKHTTLPYWLSFDAAPMSRGFLDGTTSLPNLLAGFKRPINDLQRFADKYRVPKRPRFCAACVAEDISKLGEPYWHRAHQLPNLTYCLKHRIALLSRCSECGRVPLADGMGMLQTPRLRCICGNDLTANRQKIRLNGQQKRFAKISLEALNNDQFDCDFSQVRSLIASLVDPEKLGSFIAENCAPAPSDVNTPVGDRYCNDTPRWTCQGRLHALRAPHCCALFASLKMNFKTAMARASRFGPGDMILTSTHWKIPSVASARAFVIGRAIQRGKTTPALGTRHYWVLRLIDQVWLEAHDSRHRYAPIPSVRSDRNKIQRYLEGQYSTREALVHQWELIMKTAAGYRASIRDSAWLRREHTKLRRRRSYVTDYNPKGKVKRTTSTSMLACRRHSLAIRAAIKAFVKDNVPCDKLRSADLAERAGLTTQIVQVTLHRNPDLRRELREAELKLSRHHLTGRH